MSVLREAWTLENHQPKSNYSSSSARVLASGVLLLAAGVLVLGAGVLAAGRLLRSISMSSTSKMSVEPPGMRLPEPRLPVYRRNISEYEEGSSGFLLTVSKLRRDGQRTLFVEAHVEKTFLPPLDHAVGTHWEGKLARRQSRKWKGDSHINEKGARERLFEK